MIHPKRLVLAFCLAATAQLAIGFEPPPPVPMSVVSMSVVPMPAAPLQENQIIQRIALGSCFHPQRSEQIFSTVMAAKPDLFMFIGDNVYAEDEADDPTLASLRKAYSLLAESTTFAALRRQMPLLTTWDDHDYGKNDAGGDWETKYTAEKIYEAAWAVPHTDPRAGRGGVYYARTLGPAGRRVQFILLDTRFFRTPLTRHAGTRPAGGGPYIPSTDAQQGLLGKRQWQWLEQQLSEPAELRIVVTSIQMIALANSWEAWQLLPKEKQRFFELLKDTSAKGVILVSGDRHMAAIYRQDEAPYPIYELTSSSLNLPLSEFVANIQDEAGPNRISKPYYDTNFGLIDIDWEKRAVTLSVRDETGASVRSVRLSIEQLQ